MKARPRWWRTVRLWWRDAYVLTRQFAGALAGFALLIGAGGSAYFVLAQRAGLDQPRSLVESWFVALGMIFLQAQLEFPSQWYLQAFFFVLPLLGLAVLSLGAADFASLLFNRRARGEAWHMALAETYSNHIVLIGLGHLGFRVARTLHEMGEPFVTVEFDPKAELVKNVEALGVPILPGDATNIEVLRQAGVARAHTVVVATSDDMMNMQIAIRARALNPKIRAIVRLFDDDFAREMRDAFGITTAYSASALAAPAFAAAAAQLDVVQSVALNGRTLTLSRFTLSTKSPLVGRSISAVEHRYDVSLVMLKRGSTADLHPHNDLKLQAGDEITVFADTVTLHKLNLLA